MSISSYLKQNLKTSQLMNEIYKRNITVQLEQIETNPTSVIVVELFERNKTFIHDTYKLLFIRVPFTKQSLISLALRIDNFHATSKGNTETPQLRLSHS